MPHSKWSNSGNEKVGAGSADYVTSLGMAKKGCIEDIYLGS